MYIRNSHCSFCGGKFASTEWPRKCLDCSNETFLNPIPVVVGILPVRINNKTGYLVQQRNINPKKGEWALTSGYMNDGETWQEALAREVLEETGLETLPEEYSLSEIGHSTTKSQLLIFGYRRKFITSMAEIPFKPNHEVSDLKVVFEMTDLAFESHTKVLAGWLKPIVREIPSYDLYTFDPNFMSAKG